MASLILKAMCNTARLMAPLLCVSGSLVVDAEVHAQQSAAETATPSQSSQLEEIVVTANRHGAENIQKVPMAITVVNPTTLDDLGMTGRITHAWFPDYRFRNCRRA